MLFIRKALFCVGWRMWKNTEYKKTIFMACRKIIYITSRRQKPKQIVSNGFTMCAQTFLRPVRFRLSHCNISLIIISSGIERSRCKCFEKINVQSDSVTRYWPVEKLRGSRTCRCLSVELVFTPVPIIYSVEKNTYRTTFRPRTNNAFLFFLRARFRNRFRVCRRDTRYDAQHIPITNGRTRMLGNRGRRREGNAGRPRHRFPGRRLEIKKQNVFFTRKRTSKRAVPSGVPRDKTPLDTRAAERSIGCKRREPYNN